MAYSPIQLFSTPQEDYSGWWLKFYEQGTITPLSMATNATGNTLIVKAEVSAGGDVPIGFLKTSGGALLNPFVDGDYDAWLFPTELEADEDTTVDAIQLADNLNADPLNNEAVPTPADEWLAGPTPTYINATSFTLVGDQTAEFHIGRNLKTANTGGTIYSTIIGSTYTSLTTITVLTNTGSLDSGLTTVSYGILSADNSIISAEAIVPVYGAAIASAAALPWPDYGNYNHVTGTTAITSFVTSGKVGKEFKREFDGILTLTHHATNLILPGGVNITTAAGDVGSFIEYEAGKVKCVNYSTPLIGFRGALAYSGSNQVVAAFAEEYLALDLEQYDTDSIHDVSTNNHRVVVPSGATKVKLTANVKGSQISISKTREYRVEKNSTAVSDNNAYIGKLERYLDIPIGTTNDGDFQRSSPVIEVTGGDHFCIVVQHSGSGGDQTFYANSSLAIEIIE